MLHHVLWVFLVMFVVMFLIVISSSEWQWHLFGSVEGCIIKEWLNFGSVEEWSNNTDGSIGFIGVAKHFEDILFFDTSENVIISLKIEIEIKIVIEFEWMEYWLSITFWVHPELFWVKIEVD